MTKSKGIKPRHGGIRTRAYQSWAAMLQRCTNPNHKNYLQYGGRGIRVCEAWKKFPAFFADMGEAPKGMSLDRIDFNGNYEPANCRWVSQASQCRNTRQNVFVTLDGRTKILQDWCDEYSIAIETVRSRVHTLGWDWEKALKSPVRIKTSPSKGVTRTLRGTWSARICSGGRVVSLGTFKSSKEAARAYAEAQGRFE